MKGFIFDLKSIGDNRIKIHLKDKEDHEIIEEFDPYFYFIPDKGVKKAEIEEIPEIKRIEIVEKFDKRKSRKVWKIIATNPGEVIQLRRILRDYGSVREADIPYKFRYMIDNDLYPFKTGVPHFKIYKGRGIIL